MSKKLLKIFLTTLLYEMFPLCCGCPEITLTENIFAALIIISHYQIWQHQK
jgi:hypothetical protein